MVRAVNEAPRTKPELLPTGAKIARQAFWAAADNWTQQASQLIAFLVIGNIVGPDLFGAMAMAFVYVLFVHAFLVDGFSEAIVQRQRIEPAHFDAAFWLLLTLGIVATGASYFGAVLVAAFFGQEVLVEIVRWLSLSFVIVGVCSLQQNILRRRLAFRALAVRSFVAYGGSAVIGIVLAFRGYGLWSLIIYQLSQRALDLLMLSLQCHWRPRLRYSAAHLKDLVHFGVNNTGFRVISYVGQQVERILVGLFLGATEIGLYGMARRIVNNASYAMTGVLNNVVLSVLSRQQKDSALLKRTLSKATHLTSLVTFPAFGGLTVVAPDLIRAMLRPEWGGLVVIVQILSFSGISHCLSFYLGTALRAVGRADLIFRLSVVTISVRVIVAFIVVRHGLVTMAIASVALTVLAVPLLFRLVARQVGVATYSYMRGLVPAAAATLVMMGCVTATDRLLMPSTLSSGVQTILLIIEGVVVYGLAVLVVARKDVIDVWQQLRAG